MGAECVAARTQVEMREEAYRGMPQIRTAQPSLSRAYEIRKAVLLAFCDPPPEELAQLKDLSRREQRSLLRWLDTSGLALYFLDRVTHMARLDLIPQPMLARLQENLAGNWARMNALIEESTALHRAFQAAELSYATLKGFSLWPVSVPTPELRSQLDLDFLMAQKDAPAARQILEARGYQLHGMSGRSWEFKAHVDPVASMGNLYKATSYRSVEMHLEASGNPSLLARTETLCFHNTSLPVLSPVDLFLGQGLHVYRHVCSEFLRAGHLIEFRRHVISRYDDRAFWRRLREQAEGDARSAVGLGVAVLVISRVMGAFAPEELTCWTVDRLPAGVRLWISLYGHHAVLAAFPGSKLYLLLQKELTDASFPAKRSRLKALLPRCLPPAITHVARGETAGARMRLYRGQVLFLLFRLRFHVVAGFRYWRASAQWRRQLSSLP
jgi:Uncharacterised nucleotidyltransferase